jgi:hypothetical protein
MMPFITQGVKIAYFVAGAVGLASSTGEKLYRHT